MFVWCHEFSSVLLSTPHKFELFFFNNFSDFSMKREGDSMREIFRPGWGHFWVFKRWDWPNWIKLTPAFMQQKFYCQTCFDIKVSSTFRYQGHFIELREVDTLNRLKAAPLNKNGSLPAFLISLDLWQSNIGSQVRIWKGDIYWQRRFQSW